MALGNTYNNNKNNYSPNVYSNYKFNNGESKVDATCLSNTFWNNMLKISIAPKKVSSNPEEVSFDFDNAIVIYVNHTKARILKEEGLKFLADPSSYNNVGIPSGQGLITFSNGKEFGAEGLFLVIRKISSDGVVESSYAYQFKQNYYYSIRNYDEKTNNFEKVTEDYNNIEVYQFLDLLESYYMAMTNAVAYTVIEQSKYDHTRTNNKLEAIAEKLGVKLGNKGGSQRKSSESIFNRNPSSTSTPSYSSIAIDDIAGQLEEDE